MWRTLHSASSSRRIAAASAVPQLSAPASFAVCKRAAITRGRWLSTSSVPGSSSALSPLKPRLSASADLRSSFLSYFQSHRHLLLPSSSLIPSSDDQTLLFTNAGMVQLKEMLTGVRPPPPNSHGRLTSIQKCLRAGGKHNDLENVGFTARHHTFFEMMGNFSIGSYFKEEATVLAWNYLTRELGIPASRLRISVHHSDSESALLWSKLTGFTEAPEGSTLATAGEGGKIVRLGDADNFWSMGDSPATPCGPCSEIFFDQGGEVDGERWLEVWNLVFMQYARGEKPGELIPLEKPCVDTGMGLERVAAVLQNQPTNYDSDLLRPSIEKVRQLALHKTGKGQFELQYTNGLDTSAHSTAFKVIVDHLRACAFLIADGVVPSNVGRGYVLRRIIRRAVRYGGTIGLNQPFLSSLLPPLLASLGPSYPELNERLEIITSTLEMEERNFFTTLARGVKVLEEAFSKSSDPTFSLPGRTAFLLYDTYGFPLDLTCVIAKERGRSVDVEAFEKCMQEQRERSKGGIFQTSSSGADTAAAAADVSPSFTTKTSSRATEKEANTPPLSNVPVPKEVKQWSASLQTEFIGYSTLTHSTSTVLGVCHDVSSRSLWVAVSPSPFYPSSGGQVGDVGSVQTVISEYGASQITQWKVLDTLKAHPTCDVLRVHVEGENLLEASIAFRKGAKVDLTVDAQARYTTSVHHTATHLLHSALKSVLPRSTGSSTSSAAKIPAASVNQAGSLVSSERLRFDFSCPVPLSQMQLTEIEQWVNEAALAEDQHLGLPSHSSAIPGVQVSTMSRSDAAALNAMALFGEKYGDTVRVVSVPGYSTELCGGTHVAHARSIHPFVILSEAGVASGIRRIEALAGEKARRYLEEQRSAVKKVAAELKVQPDVSSILTAYSKLSTRVNEAEKQLKTMQLAALETSSRMVAHGFLSWKGLPDRRFPVQITSVPRSFAQPSLMKDAALASVKKRENGGVFQVLVCEESGDVVIAAPIPPASPPSSSTNSIPPFSPPTAKQLWLQLSTTCLLADQPEKKPRGGGGAEVAQGVLPLAASSAEGSAAGQLLNRIILALLGTPSTRSAS